jgi:DNA-binding transcriptional LysR family regulator
MPHRRNIDMDLLRSFVTIIEVKSFTRAAERLLRTQSAISLQMKRLEEQLGCRLFERGGRGVEPTEAGTLLLGFARRILAANDELVGRMAEPLVEGRVRLGVPEGFATDQLTPVLARFGRAFPRVQMEVRTALTGDVGTLLHEQGLDLLIRSDVAGGDRLAGTDRLMSESLLWCAAEGAEPGADGGNGAGPLRLVAGAAGCPIRQTVEQALDEADVQWQLAFEGSSRASQQAAIGAGLGMGVLPRGSVLAGMHRLGEADGLPSLPELTTGLALRPGAGLVAERLRGFLVNVFEQHG